MPGGRVARILGWVVAANALAILGVTALPTPVREAAGRLALWCRLG